MSIVFAYFVNWIDKGVIIMAFFQKTILKKYQTMLPKNQLAEAWRKYQEYFLNMEIQDNIRHSKEEQFQEGFLRELFVKILGYTLNPSPDYNLITEQKNETDAKKADGAIWLNGKVIGVIELKDHKTTDLKKVEPQAFQYKSQNKEARYVIISNFEKLRLYIDNATEYREWNLFAMTETDFEELYCALAWMQIEKGIAIQMKEASVSVEKDVTSALYRDYSLFKRELFEDILNNNPAKDMEEKEWQLLLFKKTQKLLDRLLFVFFAEDGGLLPPNSMVQILSEWKQIKDLDEDIPLYNRIKKHFGYLDKGNPKKNIFAYNGGLFRTDEMLDELRISDELLYKHTKKLSEYDFKSDVDVNILGHIFEHSLSEIEEVTQRIMGVEIDSSKSKRKKDGVFYTPPYITKYIIENTVGKLCAEKKQELEIKEEEYFSDRKRQKQTKIQLLDRLKTYREWLLQLTILDPACGSGAFLNAALSFLMDEHHLIDEMEAKISGSTIVFQDVENSILENNLYGVDINEESVEIAQLALWLRTAKPQRKLSSLNRNIKCGNSLISDPAIAGGKAFDWEKEFPQVFERGGFDVVVGNPPYVRADSPGNSLEFRNYMVSSKKWITLKGKWDLYIPFLELSLKISTNKGKCAFIIPDAYCHAEYSKCSVQYMQNNKYLSAIDYFPNIEIFENVGVKSVIVHFEKRGVDSFIQRVHDKMHQYMQTEYIDYPDSLRIDVKQSVINNHKGLIPIGHICYISVGIVGNSDEKLYKGEFEVADLLSNTQDGVHSKLYYEGKDINKWCLYRKRFIEYGTERSPMKWRRKGFVELFEGSPKLVTMRSPGNVVRTMLDRNNGYFNESAIGFKRWCDLRGVMNSSVSKAYCNLEERDKFEFISEKYSCDLLLGILNSKLICYELNTDRRSNIHIYPDDWKRIMIPHINQNNQKCVIELSSLSEQIVKFSEQLQEKRNRFLRRLKDNFQGIKITGALSTFDQLEFADFLKELKKQKIVLKLSQQDEWEDYFNDYRSACRQLSEQIAETDKEIDLRVYKLYGLTYDEVLIVDAEFGVSREMYDN